MSLTVKTFALAACGLAALIQPVAAAATCANDTDPAAFRTAAVQQQLMVAALTCKDVEAYNRFVLAYQPELQKSDADLKAYFVRRGNEAEYDTFKTKLANLSSLSDIANGSAYCENAAAAFDIALKSRQALSSFVADQRLMIAMPQQTLCAAPKPAEVLTAAIAKPVVKAAEVKAAPVKLASVRAAPPVKLAAAEPESAPYSVVGVPAHQMPASPFGGEARSAPQAYDEAAYNQSSADRAPDRDDADLPLPPRPARTAQASRLEAYYAAQYAQSPWSSGAPAYYSGR